MKKSKFIIIEGIDGSGKTKACRVIKKILKKYGINNIINTYEPGGTPISEKIRNIIKYKNHYEIIDKTTILLLMYAARKQLIKNIIQPALKNNIWIISDRHDLSSFAYQGGGYQINKKIIKQLKKIVLGSLTPDLTIYLDVIPKIAMQRIFARGKIDIIEKNNLEFFNRVRKTYLSLISQNSKVLNINANLKINIVHKDIKNKFILWLNKCI